MSLKVTNPENYGGTSEFAGVNDALRRVSTNAPWSSSMVSKPTLDRPGLEPGRHCAELSMCRKHTPTSIGTSLY